MSLSLGGKDTHSIQPSRIHYDVPLSSSVHGGGEPHFFVPEEVGKEG